MKPLNHYTTDPLLLIFPNFIENVRNPTKLSAKWLPFNAMYEDKKTTIILSRLNKSYEKTISNVVFKIGFLTKDGFKEFDFNPRLPRKKKKLMKRLALFS